MFIDDEKNKIDFVDAIEEMAIRVKGNRILDIGCGKGGVVLSCAQRGGKTIGLDVDSNELKIANLRVNYYKIDNASILRGDGEFLPLRSNCFNLVTITGVLEHAENTENIIREMVRVLKPGGICYISTPNPNFPREGHYKVFWIPYLPKRMGEIYLKLRGYNPDFFINHVKYPYPSIIDIKKVLIKNGMAVQNLTERMILSKFRYPYTIETKRAQHVVKLLKQLKLNNFIARLIIRLHIYPGAHIIATRGGQ